MTKCFVVAVCLIGASASALTMEFGNFQGSSVLFDGRSDMFHWHAIPTNNHFIVVNSDGRGGSRDLVGALQGAFAIGSISEQGPRQSAQVTGQGLFQIYDGAGFRLTASVTWDTITTLDILGTISSANDANLTQIQYAGHVPDLVDLAAMGAAQLVVSFVFIPAKNLMELTRDEGVIANGFSGRITTVPEPSAITLLALGLAGLAAIVGRRKRSASCASR